MKPSATPPRKKQSYLHSLRLKFTVVFGGALLLMMLVLAGLLYQQERHFLYESKLNETQTLANTLASSSALSVASKDIVGLTEILQGFTNIKHLNRAYILSKTGEVLNSTEVKEIGLFVNDSQSAWLFKSNNVPQVLLANNLQIDVAAPIFVSGHHIAWARVEMSMDGANAQLQAVLIRGISIISICGIFVIGITVFSAEKLTKRLNALVAIFGEITQGQRGKPTKVTGNDEVSILTESFNLMIDELAATESKREKIECFYSAWIACSNVIVREKSEEVLLNRVCEVIANTVGFQLVWIGFINDETQTVENVACSHLASAYFKNLHISTQANIPEGRGATGQAIRTNKAIIFNDVFKESAAEPWWNNAISEGIHASAAFPLTKNDIVVGAMNLYSTQRDYFSEDLIGLITELCKDISYALENLEHKKRQLEQDYELRIAAAAFDSQESFMVTDANNHILRVNSGFTALTGYTANEVIGKSPSILKSGRQSAEFYESMWKKLIHERFWQGEIWNRRKDGHIFPEWLCITAISNSVGEIISYVATSNDISQRKADEERIRQLAFYDELTKLPNRTLLFQRLGLALKTSQRYNYHGALIFLDLDNFKIINDTLGHTFGDQLLMEVSARLLGCVRSIDTVARLGGDEFVIILEHLDVDKFKAAVQVQAVTEKIRGVIAEHYLLDVESDYLPASKIEYHSSCSIGFVIFLGSSVEPDELLKYADLAMYHAKKMGRNHVSVFEPEMEKALISRTELEADLRQSLLNGDEFELYLQAQTDFDGNVLGAEALVRWNHPVRGRVNPCSFIPLAEETGMIISLGEWVLREGCEILANWAKNPDMAHLKLAINVSSRQLAQDNFVENVIAVIDEQAINPAFLKLEITESMVVNNVEETIEKMLALKALGVSFSMDDFGTGYSSLSYLQKLPLTQLKIDQSFVRNLSFENYDSAIVKTIINLGENLSLNIIAEGVETESQRNFLADFGCLVFQGYFFGRPLPIREFNQFVMEKVTMRK
jgi:diguanylate cyclase (GGDEF)-like protein/PAS domain S-box-containing protein